MLHNCDLCGSSDYKSIDVARPYIGDNDPPVVCMGCGFCYVTERRSSAEIAKAWDGIWGEGYTSAWPAVKARLTYVCEWLDETIGLGGKSVLEIGAGEGSFLEMVRAKGGHPVGIEPFKGNVDQIRSKDIYCFHGTAESVEPGKHDVVCLLWTLENTGNCIGVLERAREFLNPGGYVVVATGSRILVPYKKPLSSYFSENPADTHCFRFSYLSLMRTAMLADLAPVDENRFKDSDWLVMSFKSATDKTLAVISDRPNEVWWFFKKWAKDFP